MEPKFIVDINVGRLATWLRVLGYDALFVPGIDDGGLVQAGGHGQLNGVCTHWEMWGFVQGGMTPMQALRCGTLLGARYLGLDGDLGSLEPGKLADLLVMEPGAEPTKKIRDSERILYTIANGRIFQAASMTELDSKTPRPGFFWESEVIRIPFF